MSNKDHENERQHSELAIAVCGLTCALREFTEQMQSRLATKQDVQEAVREIVLAFQATASAEDQRLLTASLGKVGRLAKRLKTVANSLAALDAAT